MSWESIKTVFGRTHKKALLRASTANTEHSNEQQREKILKSVRQNDDGDYHSEGGERLIISCNGFLITILLRRKKPHYNDFHETLLPTGGNNNNNN